MKRSFILYTDYEELFARLGAEECGNLMFALFARMRGGEHPKLGEAAEMLFAVISAQLDRDGKRYDETCKKRAEAGKLGGIVSGKVRKASCKANEANEAENENDTENEYDTEYDTENEKIKERKKEIKTERKAPAGAAARKGARSRRQDPTEERAARERFYSIRRQKAEDSAERIRQKAMLDETFAEAEREIKRTEPALARAEVKGEDTAALEKVLAAAKKRRAFAMLRLRLTESDLRPKYACKKCSDTGFLPDGHPCDCYPEDG